MVLIVSCFCISAFAVSPIVTGNGTDSADVKAKYVNNVTAPIVYSVDVTWGAMEFTYTAIGAKTWNPSTHTYTDGGTTASWSGNGDTVAVTNHSNAAIGVAFSYESLAAYSTITGAFDKIGVTTLAAGVENKPNEAESIMAKLSLSGGMDSSLTSFTRIGAVTVTLSPVA